MDDRIGRTACRILSLKTFSSSAGKAGAVPGHVLLVKLRGIGDVILALPMIEALKSRGSRITFLTGPANSDWLLRQNLVDEVLTVDFDRIWRSPQIFSLVRRVRALGADACIDLTQSAHFPVLLAFASGIPIRVGFANRSRRKAGKNGMYTHAPALSCDEHIAACYYDLLRPFGILRPHAMILRVPRFSRSDAAAVAEFLDGMGSPNRRLVGIHASGAVPAKHWPLSRWAETCSRLIDRGYTVIAVGAPGEEAVVERLGAAAGGNPSLFINAAGRLTLAQLLALMPRLDFFLANDGGPMHIAASSGLPTLGLFGAELPRRYAPLNGHSLALYAAEGLACSPCSKPYEGSWPLCRNPICMEAISVEDVFSAIKVLEKTGSFSGNAKGAGGAR